MYGFLIKDAVKFDKTIPYLGKLGFFDVCDSRSLVCYLKLQLFYCICTNRHIYFDSEGHGRHLIVYS